MRISLMAALGVLAALLLSPSSLQAQASDTASAAEPHVVVQVQGLSCPFCAYGIEKKFVEREEVDSVFVALEQNEVRLWLKPGMELTATEIEEAVEEAGFTPGRIRRPPERGGPRR